MSNPVLKTVRWTVARGPGLVFECTRCGGLCDHSDEARKGLPMAAVLHYLRAFQEIHKKCEAPRG